MAFEASTYSTRVTSWNPQLEFEFVKGVPPDADKLYRERTLSLTYVDNAYKFDTIEWKLNNYDGALTQVKYLALGVIVRVRLGYPEEATPWRTMLINQIKGGVGVQGRNSPAIDQEMSTITYAGRNRNAVAPKRGGASGLPSSTKQTTKTITKPKKIYAATSDITKYDAAFDVVRPGSFVQGKFMSDVVRQIADEIGYRGSAAIIDDSDKTTLQPLADGGVLLPPDMPLLNWLHKAAKDKKYEFSFDDEYLYWHGPDWPGRQATSQQMRHYTYGGSDVLSLTIDGDYRMPNVTESKTKGVDPKRRLVITAAAKSTSGGQAAGQIVEDVEGAEAAIAAAREGHPLTKLLGAQRASNLLRSSIVTSVPAAGSQASSKAQASFIERSLQTFKITVNLVGDPRVFAGDRCRISGTGSEIVDGVWLIGQATHEFSGDTYTTKLLLSPLPPKQKKVKEDNESTRLIATVGKGPGAQSAFHAGKGVEKAQSAIDSAKQTRVDEDTIAAEKERQQRIQEHMKKIKPRGAGGTT